MSKADGGPAFPQDTVKRHSIHSGGGYVQETEPMAAATGGMTLRDYFAAKALPAVIRQHYEGEGDFDVADRAYLLADRMLAARSAA